MNHFINKRKLYIRRIGVLFLLTMLFLTLFSNTIMNYTLPEALIHKVSSGTITKRIKGEGRVESDFKLSVKTNRSRTIKRVLVEVGDTVEEGDVLFLLEESESMELKEAKSSLQSLQQEYKQALLSSTPGHDLEQLQMRLAKEALNKAKKKRNTMQSKREQVLSLEKQMKGWEHDLEKEQAKADRLAVNIAELNDPSGIASEKASLTEMERTLAASYRELGDLHKDKESGVKEKDEEGVKNLERLIREKEIQIQNMELDMKNSKEKITKWETDEKIRKKLQGDYDGSLKKIKKLQKKLEEKTGDLSELKSSLLTKEEADSLVKECETSLQTLQITLEEQIKSEGMERKRMDLSKTALEDKIREEEERIREWEIEEGKTEITAEASGVVTSLTYADGDVAEAGTTLATIQADGGNYQMGFSIEKEKIKLVEVGQEAEILNQFGTELSATLRDIKPDGENPDQYNKLTFLVKGEIEQGEQLSVAIGESRQNYECIVPNSAVYEDINGKFVLTVIPKSTPLGTRYTTERVLVEVLDSDETHTAIQGAVNQELYVITASSKPLQAGMKVRLVK